VNVVNNMDHRVFDEQIFDQMCRGQETVPMARLQRALKKCGLWKNDPRLAETTAKMTELARNARRNNQV